MPISKPSKKQSTHPLIPPRRFIFVFLCYENCAEIQNRNQLIMDWNTK